MSGAPEEGLVEVARPYADEFTSADALVAAALARRDWRLRQAASGACEVCGAPLVARREDARTCSRSCRQKKARRAV
jgi:hypothetical protein